MFHCILTKDFGPPKTFRTKVEVFSLIFSKAFESKLAFSKSLNPMQVSLSIDIQHFRNASFRVDELFSSNFTHANIFMFQSYPHKNTVHRLSLGRGSLSSRSRVVVSRVFEVETRLVNARLG